MRRTSRLVAVSTAALLAGGLAACSSSAAGEEESSGDFEAITIEHPLDTTTIESKPERVATVQWANHEVPLALGVVPVGMAAANFGDDDGDGPDPTSGKPLMLPIGRHHMTTPSADLVGRRSHA